MQDSIIRKRTPMVRKQLLLTAEQNRRLKELAASRARTEAELVREALNQWFALQKAEEEDWKSAWMAAAGMWADRDDLDEVFRRLRGSWERKVSDTQAPMGKAARKRK